MPFKFETLHVWQLAFQLSDDVHRMAVSFPLIERFNLTSQIKRAADSVVLNIAEGSTGCSIAEQRHFLNIALKSALETVACLMMAKKRAYITPEVFDNHYERYEHLCRMITSYRNKIV